MATRSDDVGTPPLRRRIELPEASADVVGVFVNGVELRPGVDYTVRADHVWLAHAVRAEPRLRARDLVRIGLCVEVIPVGDTVDVVIRRRGSATARRRRDGIAHT